MKKKILLFALCAGFGVYVLSSSRQGGAYNSGTDGTNATGAAAAGQGCNNCHGSSTSVAVTVELDSAGVPVTRYLPGHSYTLKISGTNGTTSTLPKFGFQIVVVKSAGAGTSSAVNAGTLGTSGLPTGVRFTSASISGIGIDVLEHNIQLAAATGTGSTGTTYVMSGLPWTAPATGTGTVKIYGVINAVNNNGSSSGDKCNYATPVSITEAVPVDVATIANNMEINLYPNPVVNTLNVQLNNCEAGSYNFMVYDLNGRMMASETAIVTAANHIQTINVAPLVAGMYQVVISNGNIVKTIPVVKQ